MFHQPKKESEMTCSKQDEAAAEAHQTISALISDEIPHFTCTVSEVNNTFTVRIFEAGKDPKTTTGTGTTLASACQDAAMRRKWYG